MKPLVTIGIPTYNRFHFLKEAVMSALNQTYENIEVLIGQDPAPKGPDTNILNWSTSLAETNNKVRYYCNKKTLGLSGNWNTLAFNAKGEYIIIIGDDDRLLTYTVEKLMAAINTGNQVAFGNHYLIDQSGSRLEKETRQHTITYNRHKLKEGEVNSATKVIWQNAVPMSASVIRTSDIRRLKFKEDLNTPEIEFFLRLAQEGGKFFFIPEYIMEFRVHNLSATSSGLKIHYLLKYLIPMKADKEEEPYKKVFIQSLIVPSVSRLIQEDAIKEAKALYNSRYYPLILKIKPKSIIQFLCIYLPWLFVPLVNLFLSWKKLKP